MTTTSPVSKRIKEARLAAGLSQRNLGIAAGIDELSASARMNQYETSKHAPDFLTLKRIGKVLNLPVAYFYAESDDLAEWIKIFFQIKKEKFMSILKNIK